MLSVTVYYKEINLILSTLNAIAILYGWLIISIQCCFFNKVLTFTFHSYNKAHSESTIEAKMDLNTGILTYSNNFEYL